MTTATLARYYDTLRPSERFSLIVAARARGDTVERGRLASSDRKRLWRVGDCWAFAEGLDDLVAYYVMTQLEIATDYAQIVARRHRGLWVSSPRRDRRRARLTKALRVLAYQAVTGADAWRLICSELHLDAEGLYSDVVGYQTVTRFVRSVRKCAPSRAEAVCLARSLSWGIDSTLEILLPTPPQVAAGMWQIIEAALERWSGTRSWRLPDRASNPSTTESMPRPTSLENCHEQHDHIVAPL